MYARIITLKCFQNKTEKNVEKYFGYLPNYFIIIDQTRFAICFQAKKILIRFSCFVTLYSAKLTIGSWDSRERNVLKLKIKLSRDLIASLSKWIFESSKKKKLKSLIPIDFLDLHGQPKKMKQN